VNALSAQSPSDSADPADAAAADDGNTQAAAAAPAPAPAPAAATANIAGAATAPQVSNTATTATVAAAASPGIAFTTTTLVIGASAAVFAIFLVAAIALLVVKSRRRHSRDLERQQQRQGVVVASVADAFDTADGKMPVITAKPRPEPLTGLNFASATPAAPGVPQQPTVMSRNNNRLRRQDSSNQFSANLANGDDWLESPSAVASAVALHSPGFMESSSPSSNAATIVNNELKPSLEANDPEAFEKRRQTMYIAMAKALYSRDSVNDSKWADNLLEQVMGEEEFEAEEFGEYSDQV